MSAALLRLAAKMSQPTKLALDSFFDGFRTPPNITVDKWADEFRILPSESSSSPGEWKTSKTPYLREIMECLSPQHPARQVVFIKGSQIGGTEVGINWASYVIDLAPAPMLIVQPTLQLAERFSKQRLAKSFNQMPVIQKKLGGKSRDSGNTIFSKEFPGGMLMLGGANSAAALRSMPVKYLFCDEIDAYPADVEGEGDPLGLAIARTETFYWAKIFLNSTPTISGASKIELAYEDSDQRVFEIPCTECGEFQPIEWEFIKWEKDADGQPLAETAALCCRHCGCLIPESKKKQFLGRGKWRPTNPGNKTPGFRLSSLYAPLGWYSWARAVKEFAKAQGNPDRLKTFVNTKLGQAWEEQGEKLEFTELEKRAERYPAQVPDGVLVITAAVDVQPDRLELEILGWGKNRESWLLEYRKIPGSYENQETWKMLDGALAKVWTNRHGQRFVVQGCFVDSGDGNSTLAVYRYTKKREGRRVFSSKGRGGVGLPVISRVSKSNKIGASLYTIGVDGAKSTVYGLLKNTAPGPGYCHFPTGLPSEYYLGLTAEKLVKTKINGRIEHRWKKIRERNEPLDLRVLNLAMLELLNPNFDHLARHLAPATAATVPAAGHQMLEELPAEPPPETQAVPATQPPAAEPSSVPELDDLESQVLEKMQQNAKPAGQGLRKAKQRVIFSSGIT